MKLEDYYFDYDQVKVNKEELAFKKWYERGVIKSQAIILLLNPPLSKSSSLYIGLLTVYMATMTIANEVIQNVLLLQVSTFILCILFTPVFFLMVITTVCSFHYIFCFVWGGEEVAKKTLREIFSSENTLSFKDEFKIAGKLSLTNNKEIASSKDNVKSDSKGLEKKSIIDTFRLAKQEARRIQNEKKNIRKK
ncbi:hypothetical protein ABC382_00615 [Lysinibacillus sp. 1P01SD]|uniref:hypothetical protein n=1 Tax=Lysinibacillus sp. 1P01SD TaxID=3132285 RepID=UPI0039A288E0